MAEVYNSWNQEYKSPFGAIVRGQSCRFTVRIPRNVFHDLPPILVIFRTGYKERFFAMNETASTDEYVEYSSEYIPTNVGIHYYYFTLVCGGTRKFIKKQGSHLGIIGEGELFQLTVSSEQYKTPDVFKGGVMYQIFPDRFCKSGIKHNNIPEDRVIREDWGGTPEYRPDKNGHVWNNDYFCGDLEGIKSKLPYLKELGITCIYLNPIFEAHENHRYNTADYMKIDPLLGTNNDFKFLCAEAKRLGIGVILDGVFNHTGADSVYFNKFGRYENDGAFQSKESPYYSWYEFINYPNKYESWWGIDTLPNVNENNLDYTDFICSEGGVLSYWLTMGASGFRLDVADELPDEFLDNIRKAVKSKGKDKIVIGEVWEDASNKVSYGIKRRYLLGDQLDGTMNYPFRNAILDYIKGAITERIFEERVMVILENYPKQSMDVMMNLLSSHDAERAINVLGGESCHGKDKAWQAQHTLSPYEYDLGKKRLKCAMVLQFFLPGIPSVYYGDEAGLQGDNDPFNRRCYPWESEDVDLIEFVKTLTDLRKNYPQFKDGYFKFLYSDSEIISFTRFKDDKYIMITLNKSCYERKISADNYIVKDFKNPEVVRGNVTDNYLVLGAYDYAIVTAEK